MPPDDRYLDKTLQPKDLIGTKSEDDPRIKDVLSRLKTTPISTLEKPATDISLGESYQFNPNDPYYEKIKNPTPYSTNINERSRLAQSGWELAGRATKRFLGGVWNGIGTSLINLADITNYGESGKASSIFGYSTDDLANWGANIDKNNQIYEKNTGKSWQLTDPGWWGNIISQSGTGIGMAVSTLAQTAGIEYATGGLGTGVALERLGASLKNIFNGVNGTKNMAEALNAARGLKSAATIYAVVNRLGESKMEGQQSYKQVYEDMSTMINPDGTKKYTDEEAKHFAGAAADRTWALNLPLMMLDILTYRTMVFNPISGTGEGLLEKGLEKVAGIYGKSAIGKGAGWLTTHAVGAGLEGAEELEQQFAQDEGQHYARVLGGLDDGTSWTQRLGKEFSSDDAWNSFAGGVIGAPIIGGAMHMVNKITSNNNFKYINSLHEDFIKNVYKVQDYYADKIKEAERIGDTNTTAKYRQLNNQAMALTGKHRDAMADKDTAYNTYLNFLETTLAEANEGKDFSIKDLTPDSNITPEQRQLQIEDVKKNFPTYIDEAKTISNIYDKVKNTHNRNFVPEVVQDHFRLDSLLKSSVINDQAIEEARAKLSQHSLLSSQGQANYDAGYRLSALENERKRLDTISKSAEDDFNRENVNKQLIQVNNEINRLRTQVETSNTDETYTQEQKNKDSEIINSELENHDYVQAIHNKEAIDNFISLQRKRVALWNNPKYLESRKEKAVKTARTKQQLDDLKTNKKTSKKDTKVAKSIEEKEVTIAAKEADQVEELKNKQDGEVSDQQQANIDTINGNETIGNADLFGGKADIVEKLVDKNIIAEPEKETAESRANATILSPSVIDEDKLDDESKSDLKNAVKGMVDDLGGNSTFKDLVNKLVQTKGREYVDKVYQLLERGWELNYNIKPDPDRAIYKQATSDPLNLLDKVSEKALSDIKEGEQIETSKENKVVEDKVLTEFEKPIVFDNNDQPVKSTVTYLSKAVTHNSSPKFAKLVRISRENVAVDSEGNKVISHDFTSDELNEEAYIDIKQSLDYDNFRENTEAEIRVPPDFMNIVIPVYLPNGNKGIAMKFGDYVTLHKLTPDMQEYKDKLPMVIYKKGATTNEKGAAFVHDVGWYHENRFDVNYPEEMKEAIANTREIRKAVVANNNTSITITENRPTTFDPFKTKILGKTDKGEPIYEFIPFSQANPNATFAIGLNSTELTQNNKTAIFNDDENIILNSGTEKFEKGKVYELRRVGWKEGKKAWNWFHITPQLVSNDVQQTLLQAIKVYANQKNPDYDKTYKATKDKIQEITGLDVTNQGDLEKFLNIYINWIEINESKDPITNQTDAEAKIARLSTIQQEKSKKSANDPGTPITGYVTFLRGGNIIWGVNGQFISGNTKSHFAVPNSPRNHIATNSMLNGLLTPRIVIHPKNGATSTKVSILGSYRLNYSIAASQANKPVIHINEKGEVIKAANTYKDYILANYSTNIRSLNVGTEAKPKYVSSDNMISYKLTNKKVEEEIQTIPTGKEVVEQIKENIPDVPKDIPIDEELQKGLDMFKALGIKPKDINTDEENLSPRVQTVKERDKVTEELDKISDLNDLEEAGLVRFFTSQVFATLKLNDSTNTIQKDEIVKASKEIFSKSVEPLIQDYQKAIDWGNDYLKKFPAQLNSNIPGNIEEAKKQIRRINEIKNNLTPLINQAFYNIQKNTGVKNIRQIDSNDDNTNYENQVGNEGGELDRDWSKNVISLDPESMITSKLRIYLENIPEVDHNDKQVTTVFGLPEYYNGTKLLSILQPLLANVPASFDIMVQAIKDKAQDYTWMKGLTDKLEGANQEIRHQFTSLMAKSPLRLKFTMVTDNKKWNSVTQDYDHYFTTKVWDANEGGVADAILNDWYNKFNNSGFISTLDVDKDGNAKFNRKFAESVVNTFKNWTGENIKFVEASVEPIKNIVDGLRIGKSIIIRPEGALLNELKTKLVKSGDRMKFSIKNTIYQIEKSEGNSFRVSHLEKLNVSNSELAKWLSNFGIVLNPKTYDDLRAGTSKNKKGLLHNKKGYTWEELFNETIGPFGIMVRKLNDKIKSDKEYSFDQYGSRPLDETVIKSLAKLDAKHDTTHVPHGGRDNGKSFFAITLPTYITDRMLELKTKDSQTREELKKVSFSKHSFWLEMTEDDDIAEKINVYTENFNALKILGKKNKNDNALDSLSSLDYRVAVEGKFTDLKQGELADYLGTSIGMRWATMYSPTMSDKDRAMLLEVPVLNLKNKNLNDGKAITDEVAKFIYNQTVKPELERMINFYRNIKETNIKNYDKGAGLFLMLPFFNSFEYSPNLRFKDLAQHTNITLDSIEKNDEVMKRILQTVKDNIDNLKEEKLKNWQEDDIIIRDENNSIIKIQYLNEDYLHNGDKFNGDISSKAHMAALDLVVNEVVSLANSFMIFANDPAQAYKTNATKKENETEQEYTLRVIEDVFKNVGKRLADQIAPKIKLAESVNDQYIQLFIEDRNVLADKEFMKFSTLINDGHEISDKDYDFLQEYLNKDEKVRTKEEDNRFEKLESRYVQSAGFFDMNITDAQEYTTWKEHLDVLARTGKTSNDMLDITAQDIQDARDLFSSKKSKKDLTDKELKLIGKVLQPMKPVVAGQIFDESQDVMRHVYIKSSSFPLIPQLTEGFEIDALREAMENIEKNKNMNVRASHQSANKVGAMKNALSLWNGDGRINKEVLNKIIIPDGNTSEEDRINANGLVIPRKFFGIQQEVPFKSSRLEDDLTSYGTQLMKIIGAAIVEHDGFSYQGKHDIKGIDLLKEFNDLHIKLIRSKKQQLYDELGVDNKGKPLDIEKSAKKLQKLLNKEAEARDFPIQVTKGLELKYLRNEAGKIIKAEFVLPIWSSINSNKFESLLNAIVFNRMGKIKFPGNQFVTGSSEGFKTKTKSEDNISTEEKSRIIYTSAWNGSELQASFYDETKTKVKKAQVFISSKFKNKNNELVDLFEGYNDTTKSGKYITRDANGRYNLKTEMFNPELLNLTSYRIPTTGINSGSTIEIAGFLPAQQGDLMILPGIFTKIKGLDFDVDKETTYKYWTHHTKEGKFEILDNKHRAEILAQYDEKLNNRKELKALYKKLDETESEAIKQNILNKIDELEFANTLTLGDEKNFKIEDYSDEEIAEQKPLQRINTQLDDKITQNRILEVYKSVYNNPDTKLQGKIHSVLSTKYYEDQADLIDEAIRANNKNPYWTALSGEYQKQKYQSGASGAIAKGAYAMDITLHALAQQATAQGKPVELLFVYQNEAERTEEDEQGNGYTKSENKVFRFGKQSTTGILGQSTTVDGKGSIATVLNSTGQIGVDNEGLQILGRVNLNKDTFDVQKIFNLQGLDKGEDGNSVVFMFMSQPILREYVKKIANAKSNMVRITKFETIDDAKRRIRNELVTKYYPQALEEGFDLAKFGEDAADQMNTKTMFEAIKSTNPVSTHGLLQAGVLDRFLEMEKYGLAIRSIQTTLNVESKGLNKSFFDVIQKRDDFNKYANSQNIKEDGDIIGAIANIDSLIGDYEETPESQEAFLDLEAKGYVAIGKYMVKPTTLVGAFNIENVASAYNLWNNYLPYDSLTINGIFDEVLSIIQDEDYENKAKTVESKQDIFAEFKKYLATFKNAGMFGNEETASQLRAELYIDTKENTSLASYMQQLFDVRNNDNINTYIRTNPFLNQLEFQVVKDGNISKIIYNNTKGEGFDETYIYNSLLSLMKTRGSNENKDILLPKFGNKQYTLDTLAQALISYSFLGNAKQEAIQFTKFSPVAYLNEIGYSYLMRIVQDRLYDEKGLTLLGLVLKKTDATRHLVSGFTNQYIQHNPESVKPLSKRTKDQFKEEFTQIKKTNQYTSNKGVTDLFISVYDKNVIGEKKFRLYKLTGNNIYTEIPTLGVFGMDEYEHGKDIGTSLINGIVKPKINPTPISTENAVKPEISSDRFEISSNDPKKVIQKIVDANLGSYSLLAKELLPFISNNLKIEYNVITHTGEKEFYGVYNKDKNDIRINPDLIAKLPDQALASIIIEEVTHALTVNQVSPYIVQNTNGTVDVKGNAPSYVTDIVRLYNEVRSKHDPIKIAAVKAKIGKEPLTNEEVFDYNVSNIYEFMARAISNKTFQKYLAGDQFKQSGKTNLQKFKEFLFSVLKSLGIDFEANTAAAQAINSIFEFIEKENQNQVDIDELNTQLMWDEATDLDNNNDIGEPREDTRNNPNRITFSPSIDNPKNRVDYMLAGANILSSERAAQIFKIGDKNNWSVDKMLTELQIPKAQRELLMSFGTRNREELLTNLLANYSYIIKIETAKNLTNFYTEEQDGKWLIKNSNDITITRLNSREEAAEYLDAKYHTPTQHYSNMIVPGGTNYTENEIRTPDIIPSIKGHAQFSTDQGIGWFRSDKRKINIGNNGEIIGNPDLIEDESVRPPEITRTRRILEIQSDLFQKGRENKNLVDQDFKEDLSYDHYEGRLSSIELEQRLKEGADATIKPNQFLQLLNKDNNWVTFFVKSIIQDSAKKGYENVLFPAGHTASKVEGHEILEGFLNRKTERLNNLLEEQNQMKIHLESIKDKKELDSLDKNVKNRAEQLQLEISQIELEIKEAQEGGLKVKSIADFYNGAIKNILDKRGYKPERIKDEYGNEWYKILAVGQETQIFLSPSEEQDNINANYGQNAVNETSNNIQYTNPNVGYFERIIQLKENTLRTYKKRLGEIQKELDSTKNITADRLTFLNKERRRLTNEIEGVETLGKQGIEDEIFQLKRDASSLAVGYYVTQDLKRLDTLANSNNTDDLKIAEQLIEFYKLAGTFLSSSDNPFFSMSDIFHVDDNGESTGNFKLGDEDRKQFEKWRDAAISYKEQVKNKFKEVYVSQVNSDPAIRKTFNGKPLSFKELNYTDEGLKDADLVSMWTMDITQGIFSHNGITPQVMFSQLSNMIGNTLAKARVLEEATDEINPKVIKRLTELKRTLKDAGILGSNAVSYQLFKEITKLGHETGGLIRKYNKEFFDEQDRVVNQFWEEFKIIRGQVTVDNNTKKTLYKDTFQKLRNWRRENTIVINLRLIPEIINNPMFSEFKHQFGDVASSESYKEELVKLLGQKEYNNQINEQVRQLRTYATEKQDQIDELMEDQGIDDVTLLSAERLNALDLWDKRNSPFLGVEDYNKVRYANHIDSYNKFNVFVARKFKVEQVKDETATNYIFKDTNKLTGHYNTTFADYIENDPVLSQFHDLLMASNDFIRENLSYEEQQKFQANSLPAMLKSSAEVVADRGGNTSILYSLIEAFRHLWEKVRLNFGVIEQSENSYTGKNLATGKAEYKVNDSFLSSNERAINDKTIIERTRFLQAYNTTAETKLAKLHRFSVVSFRNLNADSLLILAEYLDIPLSVADARAGRTQSIRAITGDTVNIGTITKDYAIHSIVQANSFDLAKLIKNGTYQAAMYGARNKALPVLELMKNFYESIKNPKVNNISNQLFNIRDNKLETEGEREHAKKQMEDWFQRVALGNYGLKHKGVIGDENKDGKIALFGKRIYSKEERKRFNELNDLIEKETNDKRKDQLISIRNSLGKTRTTTAAVENLFSWIRTLRLGYNASSGLSNMLEGWMSNMIIGATGEYYDPNEIYYAYNVVKLSWIKNLSWGKLESGLAKKNRTLMDKFRVLMDTANELQKNSIHTLSDKLGWLHPHTLNSRVEYINQSAVMIAMLRTMKISDKDGKESKLWDAYETNGKLKEEFRTELNVENWENLTGEDYKNFKEKLSKALVLGHGNYDTMRGMMAKSHVAGKAAMMFKSWIPQQLYWRFGVQQDDIQSGTVGFKGKYWSYGKGSGLVHGAVVGAATFGPIGAAVGGALGLFLGAKYGTDSGVGMLKETLISTWILSKKMIGMPINTIVGRKIIRTSGNEFDKWVGNKKFTQQDANALKSNMSDIGMQLMFLALILIVKGAFYDDDDDKDDKERALHNILINRLMSLSSQSASYVSPVNIYQSTIGSNAIIQYLTDVTKEVDRFNAYLHGEDIIQSGINAGESGLKIQTKKILIPGIFKSPLNLGFDTQEERQFKPSPYDRYFKSDQNKEKESNKRDRAERRLELKNEKLDGKQIREILDEEYPTPSQLKKKGLTREEYEEQRKEE